MAKTHVLCICYRNCLCYAPEAASVAVRFLGVLPICLFISNLVRRIYSCYYALPSRPIMGTSEDLSALGTLSMAPPLIGDLCVL